MAAVVSIAQVVDALEFASDEMSSFVSTKTGEVRSVTNDELALAEDDDDPDLPDWQHEAVQNAREVMGSPEWLELPDKIDIHEWEIMDRFCLTIPDHEQQTELRHSLRGRGAFRHFKATARRLHLEESWFEYKRRALEDIAREWIAAHGMTADESPPGQT